jgi:hypothetical protein
MTRAKGALAAMLSLVLALGAVPVQAAEFARGLTLAAPAPLLPIRAPVAAAALTASFAPGAPLSAPPFSALAAPAPLAAAPAALAVPAAVPLAAAAPALGFPAQPAREAAAVSAGSALREMSAPELAPAAGRIFDGERILSAESGTEPVRAEGSSAAPPRLESAAPAPKTKRPAPASSRFLRAAAAGAGAAALAPLLWSSVPTAGALALFAVALSPVVVAGALLLSARIVRAAYRRLSRSAPARANAPPTRRAVNAIRAIGFALGIALSVTTAVNVRPIVEAAHAFMDSRLPAAGREFKTEIPGKFFGDETARLLSQTTDGRAALDRLRGSDGVVRMPPFSVRETRQSTIALPGRVFADSTIATLSRTAVGRGVLDGLRDRGGVIRMPVFFVSFQKGSAAKYTPPDAVFLSVETIEEGGVTVERFLRDRQAQLDYLQREQAVITHELEHAAQARRSPFNADTWVLVRTNGSRLVSAVEAYAAGRAESLPTASGASDAAAAGKAAPAAVSAAPVVLDAASIHRDGLTVARFLTDKQAQKDYIARHASELARALMAAPPAPVVAAPTAPSPLSTLKTAPATAASAISAPRPSFSVGFGMIQEWEYEAYITEHFYTHERLAADPAVAMSNEELWGYESGLQDFDSFLSSIDKPEIYGANFHGRSAYYVRYLAEQRAGWDRHRVEGYVLLARRDLAQQHLSAARGRLIVARAIAAENGLPAPNLAIPAR